ncbi:MAG: type II toxin-antitoxin system VapC family toxin [Candidatus Eremiobacteraeota bacterium]|nr:type II toxin-antitoxin system VapC family toxin [Candidatus Eremiobacteraeota bacterium]
MKLLLDTCTFLWIISGSTEISRKCRILFTDSSNEIYMSSVSAWEIIIKNSAGRLPLPLPARDFVPHYRELHGITELPLYEEAVLQLSRLPAVHKDPFDRMLICQSIAHSLPLLTPDPLITQYPVRTIW